MNKLLAIAIAATGLTFASTTAEAHDSRHYPSYGYRPTYRRVVVVTPTYRSYPTRGYYVRDSREWRGDRDCDRRDDRGHSHGIHGFFHRLFR